MSVLTLKSVRNFMKRTRSPFTTAFAVVLMFFVLPFTSAHAIKKCQGADGKWHYGDIAVSQCNKSKITTLDGRGFIASEKDAPKTVEQLQREKEAKDIEDASAARIKADEDERNRILSVYETEADIDRQRDNQIASVASNIAVHKAYLKSVSAKIERYKINGADLKGPRKDRNLAKILDAESRVKESTTELNKLIKQKDSIKERFDREKKIYLELRSSAS